MNIKSEKTTYIIAPRYLHKSILQSIDHTLKFKIATKEDVFKMFFPTYDTLDTLDLAKRYSTTYSEMKTYLKFVPYLKKEVHYPRTLKLKGYSYKGLSPMMILDQSLLKNSDIILLGYDEKDRDLIELLEDNRYEYRIERTEKDEKVYQLLQYKDVRVEIGEMLNYLLSHGNSDTVILAPTSYLPLIRMYANSFKLKVKDIDNSLFSIPDVRKAFLAFRQGKEVEERLITLVSPFFQYANELLAHNYPRDLVSGYLECELRKHELYSGESKYDIEIVDDITQVKPTKTLIILGYNDELFKSSKDSDYINNTEKEEDTYLLKDYEKDALTERDLKAILNLFETVRISYAPSSSTQEYRLPSLNLPIRLIENTLLIKTRYYGEFDEIMLSTLKNDEAKYGYITALSQYLQTYINDIYKTYNPHYQKDSLIPKSDRTTLSATSIALFSKCPFAYYLKNHLNIKDNFDDFNATKGSIIHKAIELGANPNDEELEEYIKSYNLTKRQRFYVDKLLSLNAPMRERLARVLASFKDSKVEKEVSFTRELEDGFVLYGKSDMIIETNSNYLVLDFKSGDKIFNPDMFELGFDVQLLTYMSLFSNKYPDKDPLGAFFVPFFPLSMLKKSKKDFMYHGYPVNAETLKAFLGDELYEEVFGKPKEFPLDQLQEDLNYLDEVVAKMVKGIKESDYDFTPLRSKSIASINSCMYCHNHDICFYQKEDVRYIKLKREQMESEVNEDE